MEYINIHSSTIDSVEFQACTDIQQATWLKLMRFLCGQENGDRIKAARTWSDRTWVRTCAVMPSTVKRGCALWGWDGDDLQVKFYPYDAEAVMKAKRTGGRNRWKQQAGVLTGEQKGKGMEGTGTEGNGSGTATEIPSDEDVRLFCTLFQDLSRAIDGIPEVWWRGWLATRLQSRNFPSDWQRCLVNAFIGDFVARHPKAMGASSIAQKKIPRADSGEVPPAPGCAPADLSLMK